MNAIEYINKDTVIIGTISGGKDSTALALWLLHESGLVDTNKIVFVHCDTGHESIITEQYVNYLQSIFGVIHRIRGKYTFETLAIKKQRFPSQRARFCTEELKVKPLKAWLDQRIYKDAIICQGIRKDESISRSKMSCFEEDGGYYDWPLWRPLLDWNVQQVFDIHKKYEVEPNPLYLMGFDRVGCFPCIMANKRQIKRSFDSDPTLLPRLIEMEKKVANASKRKAGSFFAFDKIPPKFHNRSCVTKNGETKTYGSIEAVYRWACDPDQSELDFGPAPTCMSQYGLCE